MKINMNLVKLCLVLCLASFSACKAPHQVTESGIDDYPSKPGLALLPNDAEWNDQQAPIARDFFKVKNSALGAERSGLYDLVRGAKAPNGASVDIRSSDAARRQALANFSVRDITADPGHTFVRDRALVNSHAATFKLTGAPQEKIILNIITDNSNGVGKISAVDAWSGSDELLALLKNGVTSIDKLPKDNVVILVNGCLPGKSECWKHWVRAAGADIRLNFEEKKPSFEYRTLPNQKGTIEVDGHLSNYKLGSRTSIGKLQENFGRARPKISFAIITADPPHKGHFDLSRYSVKNEGAEEAVVFINDAGHKQASEFVHRSNMTALLAEGEPTINPVQAMYKHFDDTFGRDALIERLESLYGTNDIVILKGQDAFERDLANFGGKLESARGKYLVFMRGDAGPVKIPENLKLRVAAANVKDEGNLSSSMIRSALKAGDAVKEAWMSGKVLDYIQQWGLFGAKQINRVK